MPPIKKINDKVALIALVILFTISCKKETLNNATLNNATALFSSSNRDASAEFSPSPWIIKSIGVSFANRGISEMSAPDQTTCYGLLYNVFGSVLHDITVTHDGGDTWRSQTIAGLENNYLLDVDASNAQNVHVIGWNYLHGGGNIFRSEDGGDTWQREGANAFTDAASFPDAIHFFNPDYGVVFGDPPDGSFEIYITSDGGNSWSRVPSSNIPAALPNEYGISNLSDAYNNTVRVITITYDNASNPVAARLLQSDDKGQHWYVRNPSMAYDGVTSRIKFRNQQIGLYENNRKLYRTMDGGTTWQQVDYSGIWHNGDFDNVPGKAGWWISAGGNSLSTRIGSSISYDDGDHWTSFLDTTIHTCVNMISPLHGYSGSITTGGGDGGVFVYSLAPGKLPD